MRIRPLHDRLLVKRLESERDTASAIVIPDSAAEKPDQGKVIAVGVGEILQDGNLRQLEVKAGNKVLYGKHASQTVKIGDEELLVMQEAGILSVMQV